MIKSPENLLQGKKKTLINPIIADPKSGDFGFIKFFSSCWEPYVNWMSCRDLFQGATNYELIQKGMWFCHGSSKCENVAVFIDVLETKLGISKKSIFMKASLEKTVWIQPSPFWISNLIRRSFFTLCLRCSTKYHSTKNDFNQALFNHYQITKHTKNAIKRFLKGFTQCDFKPTKITQGWGYLFSDIKNKDLGKLLSAK